MKRVVLFAGILLACSSAAAAEYTNGYVLLTSDGHYAGSVLAASPGFRAAKGECIFSLMPADAIGMRSNLGEAVGKLKAAGELHWIKRDGAIVVMDGAGPCSRSPTTTMSSIRAAP